MRFRGGMMQLAVLALCGTCFGAQMVTNGDFETGDLTGWTEMDPHYPTSPTEVFTGILDVDYDYDKITEYAGTYSAGWSRASGNFDWAGHDSTKICNSISQTWTVAPDTYPVDLSAAVFMHHDRIGQPEDFWGQGVYMRIYCDGEVDPQWEHAFWPHDGDSFWRYEEHVGNDVGTQLNEVTTTTGQVRFEVGWVTKWGIDVDASAVDNISVYLMGATKEGGAGEAAAYDDPAGEAPVAGTVLAKDCCTATGDSIFRSACEFDTGLFPVWQAVADFNEDGHQDIATVNQWDHSMTVMFGRGDGTFGDRADIATGYNPRAIETADFNNDDYADLVTSNMADHQFQVFLGVGDGTFTPLTPVDTESHPWGMCAADFDADDNVDLAITHEDANSWAVHLGDGDGTFTLGETYSLDAFTEDTVMPRFVHAGDFNNDEVLDMLVLSWFASDIYSYSGDGDGTFTFVQQRQSEAWQMASVCSADFNNDGNLDALHVETWGSGSKFWIGNGDCTFNHGEKFGIGRQPMSVVTCDLDRDGEDDFVAANLESHDLIVYYGIPVPYYREDDVRSYTAGDTPHHIVTSDFNEDGIPDFAVACADASYVSVALGSPDGLVDAGSSHVTDWSHSPRGVACADFDVDGDLDVAVSLSQGGPYSTPGVYLHRNDGSLQFGGEGKIDFFTELTDIVAEDFDGDDIPDIAIAMAGQNMVRVRMGLGDFTFPSLRTYFVGTFPNDLLVADFNADTYPDIASANLSGMSVTVLLNRGDGVFLAPVHSQCQPGPASIAARDFNGDTNLDAAVACSFSNSVNILLGNGAGNMTLQMPIAVGSDPNGIVAEDFDGDGEWDLAVSNKGSDTITLLFGDGDGTFSGRVDIPAGGEGPMYMDSADFNGDGFVDIAVGNDGDGSVSMYLGNGDGTFADPETHGMTRNTRRLVAADMWGDGLPDLIITSPWCDRWRLFRNRLGESTGSLDGGWNLCSVPLAPYDAEASAVFGDVVDGGGTLVNSLYNYDNATGYDSYPTDFTEMELARGYWLLTGGAVDNTMVGEAAREAQVIALSDGWNLIGHPQSGAVALADCQLTDGVETKTVDEAATAGWLQSPAYYYETGVGYHTLATSGADDDAMRPWLGYWMLTYEAGLSLIVPLP